MFYLHTCSSLSSAAGWHLGCLFTMNCRWAHPMSFLKFSSRKDLAVPLGQHYINSFQDRKAWKNTEIPVFEKLDTLFLSILTQTCPGISSLGVKCVLLLYLQDLLLALLWMITPGIFCGPYVMLRTKKHVNCMKGEHFACCIISQPWFYLPK